MWGGAIPASARGGSRRVALLSVLNPWNHPRLWDKQARSLAAAGWQVAVVAQADQTAPFVHQGIQVLPLPRTHRLSIRRLALPGAALKLAQDFNPHLAIVHSPELLGPARRLAQNGCPVVYDRHEDYPANLLYSGTWPPLVRNMLAWRVAAVERAACDWLAGVCYAEQGFVGQVPAKQSFVAPNLCMRLEEAVFLGLPDFAGIKLLQSGTLSWQWGLKPALQLWQAMNQHHPTQLTLAGFAPEPGVLDEVEQWAQQRGLAPLLRLVGGWRYLSPLELQAEILRCHVGLALYEPMAHFDNRLPARFFEYLAWARPLIVRPYEPWLQFLSPWQAAIPLKAEAIDSAAPQLLAQLMQLKAQPLTPVPAEVWSWKALESDWLQWLDNCA